jgi:hypothetical protein
VAVAAAALSLAEAGLAMVEVVPSRAAAASAASRFFRLRLERVAFCFRAFRMRCGVVLLLVLMLVLMCCCCCWWWWC